MDSEYNRRMFKIIGQKIREGRIAKGLSQKELGELIFVDRSVICSWERGYRSTNLITMADLHKALGVPLWGLLLTEEELSQWQEEENDNE